MNGNAVVIACILAVEPVGLPSIVEVGACAIFDSVTALVAMVAACGPLPNAVVTSPVSCVIPLTSGTMLV